MIDLVLLGCGGNDKGKNILIDCGEGTQVSMRMKNCGFKDVDLILITHLHGDHIIGLIGLLSTMGNSGKVDDLTIVGPRGIIEAIKAIKVLVEYLPYNLNIIENPLETFSLENHPVFKDLQISTLELDHSTECLGYSLYFKRTPKFNIEKAKANNVPQNLWSKLQKIDSIFYDKKKYTSDMVLGDDRKGVKLSFITDTRFLLTIPDFIRHSDLFVCEGMYGDDMDISKAVKNKHMTFNEAASLASLGEVKQLLLTHFSPSLENPHDYLKNATRIFPNTIIGEDRLSLSLNYEN